MALDLVSFDAALKQHYDSATVQNMVYKDNPLFAMMPKRSDFGGRNLPVVPIYGNPQGRSAAFARAQARGAVEKSKLDDFLLTRVKDYGVATIDNETLEASKGNANALLEAASLEIDGIINSLTRSIAIGMYRQGYGEIGQISATSSVTSTVLTLSNPDDIVNFEIGQELDVAASLTGASKAYGTSTNGLIVTGVNRSAGTVSFGFNVNDAANGIPTIAVSDFIFVRGDHSGSTRSKLAGLEAWCPFTKPSGGDNFFGVDRSVDSSRLAGLALDGRGAPIEEILIDGAAQVGREGYALTHYFMNFKKYAELEKSLGSKIQYIDMSVNAQVAFRGIMINGVRGPVRVVADQNCPADRIYGLKLDSWKLATLGEPVRVIDTDGLSMLRQASADGVECRYGFYGNMYTNCPAGNISIQV